MNELNLNEEVAKLSLEQLKYIINEIKDEEKIAVLGRILNNANFLKLIKIVSWEQNVKIMNSIYDIKQKDKITKKRERINVTKEVLGIITKHRIALLFE